jgi:NAD-dependent deacetylase
MKKLVVLTGAGISAESGISTFRGAGGLWEGHDIMEVASPIGWNKNPELVLDFYNQRRKQAKSVNPNAGHLGLVELETEYDVWVVTQNVDDLHERAGSSKILHLHGMLNKARSVLDENHIVEVAGDIALGDFCPKGGQLRPHIVWFGEEVPAMEQAVQIAADCDLFAIVGTSLAVYPAAGLVQYIPSNTPVFIVDPNIPETGYIPNLTSIEKGAVEGVPELARILRKEHL